MKLLASLALAVFFLPAARAAEPVSRSAAIDALTPEDLDEITALLREQYLSPEALSEMQLKRATVQGLLDRLGAGASIVEAKALPAAESPFRTEVLEPRIAYVRLGALNAEHLAQLDAALEDATAKSLGAVVLDLRATPAGNDLEQAAEVCRRFTPKGKVLFIVKKPRAHDERVLTSRDDPKYRGRLVVLVDGDSAGSSEVIAAVLRLYVQAMVIGQRTKGEAVEFANMPLPGGKALRVAVAEVSLPNAASVFPGGLTPDLVVEVPQPTTDTALAAALEQGAAALVVETERKRMNEAALVAGINPEVEAIEAAQHAKAAKEKPPLRDVVLQRAVDFVIAVGLGEKKPAPTE
jgi:C-terminal processing protease CtpA/Prc